ncbi:MAG TPA: hypothetical protein DCY24_04590 [Rikenellaceae bacterium]|nr:hypothetical protein [Rikenellaceae bacterium]
MKKKFLISILLLAAACSKSGTMVEDDSQIRFDLGFSGQTRVMANAFESGDVTGLYMTEYDSSNKPAPLLVSGNAVNNAALRFDGTSWATSPTLFWEKGVKYDVYGYYPYASPSSVEEYNFSVGTDQTTLRTGNALGGYEASDFLWAKQTGVKYPDVVNLTFSHRMSRLVVNLVKGKDFEGDMPKDVVVKVHGTVPDAIVDLGSGVVVKDNYGKAKTITMKKESDTVFSSIIVPQRIDNRQPLIEVLTSNVSYLMESRFVFRSGIQHSINIILDSDPAKVKIEIGGEIQGWN